MQDRQPIAAQAGVSSLPERRRRAQRQQVRQEIRHLVQHVDPVLRIRDPHVHVHPADHHPLRQRLHVFRQRLVALPVRRQLPRPERKRMSGGRHDSQLVRRQRLRQGAPQRRQPFLDLRDRAAHARADLDLRAQELRAHAADFGWDSGRALMQQRPRRVGHQVPRVGIDDQVFLFHPDRELRQPVNKSRHARTPRNLPGHATRPRLTRCFT